VVCIIRFFLYYTLVSIVSFWNVYLGICQVCFGYVTVHSVVKHSCVMFFVVIFYVN